MALVMNIRPDPKQAWAQVARNIERRFPRAAATALNRTAQAGQTAAVRAIQHDVGAGAQKTIRRNLSLKRATPAKAEASIIARSAKKDRIPIYEMQPRPRSVTKHRPAVGVSYGKQGKRIPGSFIARMRSGHVGVFARRGRERTPIGELFGPSVALVLSRKRVYGAVQKLISERLPRELARAFRFVGGGRG